MKKSIFCSVAICLLCLNISYSQVGGLLKKVTKSVTNEVLGKPAESPKSNNSNQPEPSCACDQSEIVLDLGGKLQLDYKELSVSTLDDGRLLVKPMEPTSII